jgi:hypothetical protein
MAEKPGWDEDWAEAASIDIAHGWLNGLARHHDGECDGWEQGPYAMETLPESGATTPEDMTMIVLEEE